MTEDYFSASLRHLRDSQSLADVSDNAGYLAGYVIECGLKRLLELSGSTSRAYGHDLKNLQGRALTLAALLAPSAVRYRVDTIADLEKASGEWSPDLRYWASDALAKPSKQLLLKVADELFETLLVPLVLDGVEACLR